MITVHKYRVQLEELFTLVLPQGAEFLSVQTQHGNVEMWFRVDTSQPTREQLFGVCGTGNALHHKIQFSAFLGTFQLQGGNFVFHLFGGLYA